MSTMIVFPGQGSQKAGMAMDFVSTWAESRQVFEEASEALGLDMLALCGVPEDPRLGLTEYTQPAILTAEIAMVRALEANFGLKGDLFGGHSLGEYSALVAAGVIPLAEAARLVRERGRRMQEAVPVGEGAMAAVMRADLDPAALRAALVGLDVDVANHNAPDQVVISGRAAHMDQAIAAVLAGPAEGGRVRMLEVSAPFHSRLMAPIEPGFRALLEASAPSWHAAGAARVACNFTGDFHQPQASAVVDALTAQISGGVRWVDNMRALMAAQPTRLLEVGPNRPLRGFFRALDVEVEAIFNVVTARRVLG